METLEQRAFEYLSNRTRVNRESARQRLKVNGEQLNSLLKAYGFERDKSAGLKRYSKIIAPTKEILKERRDQLEPITFKKSFGSRLILTSYLVGSTVFKPFWENLVLLSEQINADIIVLPMRYRNPTVLQEAIQQDSEQYIDPLVIPYLCVDRFQHGFVKVLADIKINPTNIEPLNTLTSFSYGDHIVVGHSTQQIKPLTNGKYEKTLTAWSTGSCSIPELSDSLAGKKAELHHRFGAVIADYTSIRSFHATKKGVFIDQGLEYDSSPSAHVKIKKVKPVACVMGDLHYGQEDRVAYVWALQRAKEYECDFLILNDSFDGSTVNHHVKSLSERTRFFDTLFAELANHRKEIKSLRDQGFKPYLVHSNHTDFITRWAAETERNQVHFKDLEIFDRLNQGFNIENYLDDLLGCVTLQADLVIQSFRIVHGHERFGGARGGIKSYNQTGTRTAYGHTHKVESLQGHENVGCLCLLDPEYVQGFSSWIHSVGFIWPNGKFTHEIRWE